VPCLFYISPPHLPQLHTAHTLHTFHTSTPLHCLTYLFATCPSHTASPAPHHTCTCPLPAAQHHTTCLACRARYKLPLAHGYARACLRRTPSLPPHYLHFPAFFINVLGRRAGQANPHLPAWATPATTTRRRQAGTQQQQHSNLKHTTRRAPSASRHHLAWRGGSSNMAVLTSLENISL